MEKQIDNLIMAYLYRTISDTDRQILEEWLNESEANLERFRNLTNLDGIAERVADWQAAGEDKERAWQILQDRQKRDQAPIRRLPAIRKYWQVAAAAAVIIVGTAIYFGLSTQSDDQLDRGLSEVTSPENDVQPGGQKAVLLLANGSSINLDSSKGGVLAKQGNIDIVKGDGALSYKGDDGTNEEILYNTLMVPKGGQYRLLLNDGTKVWLNSSSSIRYPAVFSKTKERNVEVSGEVYFEVASLARTPSGGGGQAKVPFIVSTSKGVKVEVLGTHFNINAYEDEQEIATTLLEGKVKVTQSKLGDLSSVILHPGEQAIARGQQDLTMKGSVDVEQVMAWKNGKFYFNNTDLAVVMRQISRWYDVDIVYEGKVPAFKLSGEASRNLTLANLLSMFASTDVKCRIEGKKLIIPQQ